jgi:(1->4)-alpha-D-glucan 1-alpha-D-glucosylmutase
VHSSWINPDPEYESAMSDFIAALLSPSPRNRFVGEFATSAGELARFGMINSLAMTLIKLTSPGVPDIYRGDELWDFSLVDPDNRRPVDFARRAELLEQLARADREQPLATARQIARALEEGDAEGISKLFVTWRLLGFRRDHDALFRDGSYLPINATGDLADHVCAYARRHEGSVIVAVAPRLCAKLMRGEPGLPLGERSWAATALDLAPLGAIGGLANVLTGESLALRQEGDRSLLPVAEVLGTLPVALLHFEGPPPPSGAT